MLRVLSLIITCYGIYCFGFVMVGYYGMKSLIALQGPPRVMDAHILGLHWTPSSLESMLCVNLLYSSLIIGVGIALYYVGYIYRLIQSSIEQLFPT